MIQYSVRNTMTNTFYRDNKVVPWFTDKQEAKKVRKECNGTDKDGNELFKKGWVVTSVDNIGLAFLTDSFKELLDEQP